MGKITWIAGGNINETAKNDITTYTGGNSNSYGQQVTHDAPEINWGDEPEDPPDDSFAVSVYDNGVKIVENSFVFITPEPAMPKIKIETHIGKNYKESLRFRLKTEFIFTATKSYCSRNDVDYFPDSSSHSAFMIAEVGKTTSWDVDFRGVFRGGTATVEIWNEAETAIIQTFRFYIRGQNPTKEVVKKYLQDKGYLQKYWFLFKLIVGECDSDRLPVTKQFWDPEYVKITGDDGKIKKVEAHYGPSGREIESKGIPNYGYPDGWGVCQIDFKNEKEHHQTRGYIDELTKNPNYIWNWKENINVLMQHKLPDKITAATNHIKFIFSNKVIVKSFSIQEGMITYKTCPSAIQEFSEFNKYMHDTANNVNEKSILDAELIKLYNGYHYITGISADGTLKIWQTNNLGFDYNERVGNIKD